MKDTAGKHKPKEPAPDKAKLAAGPPAPDVEMKDVSAEPEAEPPESGEKSQKELDLITLEGEAPGGVRVRVREW
ncbi:hypothetical protein chiPu_0026052, partial [Chiloscyllium punctatum]|nr:hypothetical protein [Chiloscyllium punctatum]